MAFHGGEKARLGLEGSLPQSSRHRQMCLKSTEFLLWFVHNETMFQTPQEVLQEYVLPDSRNFLLTPPGVLFVSRDHSLGESIFFLSIILSLSLPYKIHLW